MEATNNVDAQPSTRRNTLWTIGRTETVQISNIIERLAQRIRILLRTVPGLLVHLIRILVQLTPDGLLVIRSQR